LKNQDFHRQVPKNLIVNIFSFISTILIGLWLTPYLLKQLGIAAYGIIPLAMFLSQYVGVIINSINMSIGRFLLISLQKKEDINSKEIFNTSLVIIIMFTLLQALIMFVMIWDITFFFVIPETLIEDAKWLFGLTFIGFSVSLFRSVFGTSLYTYNRLDILRIIDFIQNLIRVILIIILFISDEPSIKYVGIANMISSILAFLVTLHYFKQYTPQLKINILFFRLNRVIELSKMSIWILINQVGALLLGNVDLYMVNNLLGTKATGEYAIIVQLNSLFRTLLTLIASVISPVIMIYYSNHEIEKLKAFLVISMKFMMISLILPLATIIGLSEHILDLWLGEKYIYLHMLVSFSMLFYIFVIPMAPLFNVNIAYNKVKVPALVALVLGVFNIIGIYLLLTQTGLYLWGVLIIKLFFELFFSFFILQHVSKILSMTKWELVRVFVSSLALFMASMVFVILGKTYFNLGALGGFMIFVIGLHIIILPVIFMLLVNKEERRWLLHKLIKKDSFLYSRMK